jgi:phospholipase C
LRSSPDWNNTILIVTYDEHGGLYDHVPVPSQKVPNPDGRNSTNPCCVFDFTRIGVRVPFVVASPLVAADVVPQPTEQGKIWEVWRFWFALIFDSKTFEQHTSVMKTLRHWLNMSVTRPLTLREEWAPSFEHLLLSTPRTDTLLTLPLSKKARSMWPAYKRARMLASSLTDKEIEALPDGPAANQKLSDMQIPSWNQAKGSAFLRRMRQKLMNLKKK